MNINKIYASIEAKITQLTGSRPNATERLGIDLGLDSLDTLDIITEIERNHNVSIPNEVNRDIPADATLLDLTILFTDKINEE